MGDGARALREWADDLERRIPQAKARYQPGMGDLLLEIEEFGADCPKKTRQSEEE
jgi:hypothetical protein